MAHSDRGPHRIPVLVGLAAAVAGAFVLGRFSASDVGREASPLGDLRPTSRPQELPAPEPEGVGASQERTPIAGSPAAPTPQPTSSRQASAPPTSGDRGLDALAKLLDKTKDDQAVEQLVAGQLQPTLDLALTDKNYNPRGLDLSPEQRVKFDAWIGAFDATIRRLAAEHEATKYQQAIDRIRSGNEIWVEATTAQEVASALTNQSGTAFVVQTDFPSREAVSTCLTDRFAKLGRSTLSLSTGGSRNGTARFTVFVDGDGSGVLESAKELDEAVRFRRQAIRDHLSRL